MLQDRCILCTEVCDYFMLMALTDTDHCEKRCTGPDGGCRPRPTRLDTFIYNAGIIQQGKPNQPYFAKNVSRAVLLILYIAVLFCHYLLLRRPWIHQNCSSTTVQTNIHGDNRQSHQMGPHRCGHMERRTSSRVHLHLQSCTRILG